MTATADPVYVSREHGQGRAVLRVAERAGIEIPAPILQARRRVERVMEHARAVQTAHPGEEEHVIVGRFADEILAAADAGDVPTLDVFAAVDEAQRARRAQDLSLEVAREAVDRAWRRLRVAIMEETPALFAALRGRLEETIAEIGKTADELEGHDLDVPTSVMGSARAGKAYQAIAAARRRYLDLRELQRLISGAVEQLPELALYRNAPALWADAGIPWIGHRQASPNARPWPVPEDSLRFTLWLATGRGGRGELVPEVWAPTPEELQEAERGIAAPLQQRAAPGSVLIHSRGSATGR